MPRHSEKLLGSILANLKADVRVDSAWLAGSRGRGEADEFSDIDIWVAINDDDILDVVADPLKFLNGITPTILHVIAPGIAPAGGAFIGAWVPIDDVFEQVDWYICPTTTATRQSATHAVIGEVPTLDLAPPEQLEKSEVQRKVNDNLVLALIMINNCLKHARRGDFWRSAADAQHSNDCLSKAHYLTQNAVEPLFDMTQRSFLTDNPPNSLEEAIQLAIHFVDAVGEIAAIGGISQHFQEAIKAMRAEIHSNHI